MILKPNFQPIIDAYRQNQPAPQGNLYNEFNHYDSMKHASPSDPATYFALKPMTEVNEGRQFSIPTSSTRRYDQVPIDPSPELQRREVPSKQSPPNYPKRSSVFGGRVSPLPRQSEVDPHPMPRYIPPMSPRYERTPKAQYCKTTTVTTYTTYGDTPEPPRSTTYSKASKLKETSVKPYATYSRGTKLPKYDEVPRNTMYSRASEASKTSSRTSLASTCSRASKLPKYDQIPRSPSVHSLYCRIPTYDEVPVQKSPRSITPTPMSHRVRIQTSPPIPPSSNSTYVIPVKVDRRSDSPRTVIIPFSSNSTTALDKVPQETPIYRRISKPSQTKPTNSRVSSIPLSQSYHSMDKITMTSVYRTTATNNLKQEPIVIPRPTYRYSKTPLQKEIPPVPLERSVIRQPEYSDPGDSRIIVIPFSNQNKKYSPPPSRSSTPIYHTNLQRDVPTSPLPRRPLYSRPPSTISTASSVEYIPRAPVPRRPLYDRPPSTISPPRSPPSELYLTPLEQEVQRAPLSRRPLYSRPPSTASAPRSPQPKIYLTRLQKEVPHVPLYSCVARPRPVYSTPPEEPIVIPRAVNPPVSSTIYLTRLEPEVPGTPLQHYIYRSRSSSTYSVPPVEEASTRTVASPSRYTPPPSSSPKMHLTHLEREVPGTPLNHYISRPRSTPIYSTPPEDRNVVSPSRYTPPPSVTMAAKLHLTPLQPEVPSTPLQHYISRSRASSVYNTPSVDSTSTRSLVSPSSVRMPPKLHLTRLQQDVPWTPFKVSRPRSTPIYSTPPLEKPISRTLVTPSRRTPPQKLHQISLDQDIPGTPLQHYIYRSRSTSTYSIPLSDYPQPSPTPSSVIMNDDSPYEEKPKSYLGTYPKTYTRIMPERPPKIISPPEHPVTVSKSKSTQTLDQMVVLPQPKTHLYPEISYRRRRPLSIHVPAESKSSTIISIYSNPIDDVPPTHVSELHAEKRMIVGIDDELQPEKNNVTYVTVATAAIDNELLHRHPEVGRHPVYVLPAQTSYGASAKRRSSDDEAKNVLPPQNCTVEHCTHVAVNDGSPVVIRKRASQDSIRDKVNSIIIFS